ncbi:hypothetical protein Sjap_022629 [Stephania japonica]|uniref:Uncharacterized protein n=1 Tax=Stephania japonica TaxID=461633 RepID=A0AAP0ESC6_9MAGN
MSKQREFSDESESYLNSGVWSRLGVVASFKTSSKPFLCNENKERDTALALGVWTITVTDLLDQAVLVAHRFAKQFGKSRAPAVPKVTQKSRRMGHLLEPSSMIIVVVQELQFLLDRRLRKGSMPPQEPFVHEWGIKRDDSVIANKDITLEMVMRGHDSYGYGCS